MTIQAVFDYVDAHADAFVERLRALCRQPSVSAQGIGLEETARMVAELTSAAGFVVRTVPLEGGPPVVYGEAEGDAPRTLTFYDHYDVQPPEPLDLWRSDPFGAEVRAGRIWARGVSDNKGNLVARLCAVEAYRAVFGRLPLRLKCIFEGEEEIGSPHLEQFAREHPDLVRSDGCIWEAGYKDPAGRPTLSLGCKGIAYFELRARGAARDLHSSWATIIPNAAWQLTWALATLKGPDERVRLPGFYDRVRPPTAAERALLDRIPFEAEALKRINRVPAFVLGLADRAALERHLFEPTCTICGLSSGYEGPGSKTVLPATAVAKLDFRLVPDQDPDEVAAQLRAHLVAEGFGEIEVVPLNGERPARTPVDDPLVTVAARTAREVYGVEPVVLPTMAGTGPMWLLAQQFGIPAVGTGVGNAESNNHAPNENILIGDYLEGIKHIALLFHEFARSGT